MGIQHRSFTYRGQIKVSRRDLQLARQGRKTCTIRLGTAKVEGSDIDLSDGREHIRVRILRVETDRPYASISDEEAVADGVTSRDALDSDLRRFYGSSLDAAQPMTLIHFALLEGTLHGPMS